MIPGGSGWGTVVGFDGMIPGGGGWGTLGIDGIIPAGGGEAAVTGLVGAVR